MKFATYSVGDSVRTGVLVQGGIVDIRRHIEGAPEDMVTLIAAWPHFGPMIKSLESRQPDYQLSAVQLRAPVASPRNIFAIGLNYADHIAESGLERPGNQVWFSKSPTAVSGPYDGIELPAVSEQLDYECELVVVIGKRCRNVPRNRAKEVIFGYCVGNDVSVRDWQLRTSQWVVGKSFDTHAPIGPWISTADTINPHTLAISTQVNGEVRQQSNTRQLVFDCYDQIEYLTKAVTLQPGDLLFTGTCGGVAAAFKPPRWLKVNDTVLVEIEQLGYIENRVFAGSADTRIE